MGLNSLLYYFYYESENIYFIDLLDDEYKFILKYLENNLVAYEKLVSLDNDKLFEYSMYISTCITDINKQKYKKIKNEKFYNIYTQEIIEFRDVYKIDSENINIIGLKLLCK